MHIGRYIKYQPSKLLYSLDLGLTLQVTCPLAAFVVSAQSPMTKEIAKFVFPKKKCQLSMSTFRQKNEPNFTQAHGKKSSKNKENFIF